MNSYNPAADGIFAGKAEAAQQDSGLVTDDLSAWAEQNHGIKSVEGLTMGQMADKIIANAAQDTPARVEDAIIDAHNAPHGMQFQIASRHTDVLPMNAAPFYRVYFSIPDCNITGYNSHEYLDAVTAAEGAIFCGSPYATIEYILGNVYTQELVQAVS